MYQSTIRSSSITMICASFLQLLIFSGCGDVHKNWKRATALTYVPFRSATCSRETQPYCVNADYHGFYPTHWQQWPEGEANCTARLQEPFSTEYPEVIIDEEGAAIENHGMRDIFYDSSFLPSNQPDDGRKRRVRISPAPWRAENLRKSKISQKTGFERHVAIGLPTENEIVFRSIGPLHATKHLPRRLPAIEDDLNELSQTRPQLFISETVNPREVSQASFTIQRSKQKVLP